MGWGLINVCRSYAVKHLQTCPERWTWCDKTADVSLYNDLYQMHHLRTDYIRITFMCMCSFLMKSANNYFNRASHCIPRQLVKFNYYRQINVCPAFAVIGRCRYRVWLNFYSIRRHNNFSYRQYHHDNPLVRSIKTIIIALINPQR